MAVDLTGSHSNSHKRHVSLNAAMKTGEIIRARTVEITGRWKEGPMPEAEIQISPASSGNNPLSHGMIVSHSRSHRTRPVSLNAVMITAAETTVVETGRRVEMEEEDFKTYWRIIIQIGGRHCDRPSFFDITSRDIYSEIQLRRNNSLMLLTGEVSTGFIFPLNIGKFVYAIFR